MIREINSHELKMIGGGFWPIVFRILVPTVVNMVVYSATKKHKEEEVTPQGLAIAAGTGVVSGGIGAAGATASGGGLIGAAVWAPGTTAINASGNLIAQEH